ncbi:MAG: serine/threonine-protein kinase [Myxococcota bacterium]
MTSLNDLRELRPEIEPEQVDELRRRLFGGGSPYPPIPGYEVHALLGKGAFGRVYRAFDPRFGRTVALKVVEVESASDRIRIEREALALARLSHPNVVQVYDRGPVGDDAYFLALEYVQGPDLEHWLHEAPRTSREILTQFLDVAEGLAAAHDAGLVHRDFKPNNAIVGHDGRVRVLDFGLARCVDDQTYTEGSCDRGSSMGAANDSGPGGSRSGPPRSRGDDVGSRARLSGSALRLTQAGHFVGTPYYAAPEQYDGRADARSDQFSFFVALYEALYGRRPFRGHPGDMPWLPPPPTPVEFPRKPRRRVSRALRRLLRQGLAYDAEERHPSMTVVAQRLRRLLDRGAGWRRTLAMAGGAAVLTAAVTAGLGLGFDNAIERCRAERSSGPADWVEREPWITTQDRQLALSLARYAERWQESRQAACHVVEPEPRAKIEACLEQGAERLGELSDWLTGADRRVWTDLVEHPGPRPLVGLLATLPEPTRCLTDSEPRTGAEHRRAWRALLEARAAVGDGKPHWAAEQAERAAELARRVGDRPLWVAAEYQRLKIDTQRGRPHALWSVLSLLVQALEAGERELAADIAATSMSRAAAGTRGLHPDSAQPIPTEDLTLLVDELAALRAAGREAPIDPVVTAWLRYAEGHASMLIGDYVGARERYREAGDRLARVDPPVPDHLLAVVELNEAIAIGGLEPPVLTALPMATRALAIRRAELGPEHPAVAAETWAVGELHVRLEDFEGALTHYREAERIFAAHERALDRAFVQGEIVYVHWLAASQARSRAQQAERANEPAARHWAQFERRRHLALRETLDLERRLPLPLGGLDSGPSGEPQRATEQARLWVVMMRSYLYHRGCWDESMLAGRRLERACTALDGSEPSCASGRRILRSMLEQDVSSRRSASECRADPERIGPDRASAARESIVGIDSSK